MHFYWRIIEELKFIGETWVIKDPSLRRNYEHWLNINAEAIALSTMDIPMGNSEMFNLGNHPYVLN